MTQLAPEAQDTTNAYNRLVSSYISENSAIPVNFRELVPWLPYNSKRYTHSIHSYPAKVIPQIPIFFLESREIVPRKAVICDPFSGSGTVGLEACLRGHDVIASDTNPLARLLVSVKTNPISPGHLARSVRNLKNHVSQCRDTTAPDVVNIEYWYKKKHIKGLSRVANSLAIMPNSGFKRLAQVALSSTSRKLSLADPRISVPVRLKPDRYTNNHPLYNKAINHLASLENHDAIELYFATLSKYAEMVSSLWPNRDKLGQLKKVYLNSLGKSRGSIATHEAGSVDSVITSPPYLGAQKYIRASSLSLGWLSLTDSDDLAVLDSYSIGRERLSRKLCINPPESCTPQASELLRSVYKMNSLRAHIAAQYLSDMQQVMLHCYKLLKKNGSLVLVSGNNMLCGQAFDTTSFLNQICTEIGFQPILEVSDIIKSRGLMTRRNKTASLIPLESVTVYKK